MNQPTKAVILARGLGTRMRRISENAELTQAQRAAASSGMKAMMPDATGRPFLDHSLNALADAGITEVCLVVAPDHDHIKNHYDKAKLERISVSYAVQEEPLGTANAVLAAEEFAGSDRVLVLNGDNYYPANALTAVGSTTQHALVGFDPEELGRGSNIPADRISAFAVLDVAADGKLLGIVEKPTPEQLAARQGPIRVSMNCFCFAPSVFEACRQLTPSARGEYEITDAVRALVEAGEDFAVVDVAASVWDLSGQDDVAAVSKAFSDRAVHL